MSIIIVGAGPNLGAAVADTIEVESGYCAMVSHPEETYGRIVAAAKGAASG